MFAPPRALSPRNKYPVLTKVKSKKLAKAFDLQEPFVLNPDIMSFSKFGNKYLLASNQLYSFI